MHHSLVSSMHNFQSRSDGPFIDHLMTRVFFNSVRMHVVLTSAKYQCASHGVAQNAILITPPAVSSKGVEFLFMWLRFKSNKLALTRWRHLVAVNVTAITVSNVTLQLLGAL